MRKTRCVSLIFAAFVISGIQAATASAGGFNNTCIGLKGMVMGHCLTGIADDASAVYFNPAGLACLDKDSWHGEVYGYYAPTKFKYHENSTTDESNELVIVPSFFLSRTYDDWGLGLGFHVPFAGGGTAYDNFQNSGFDLECFAAFSAISLAVGYKLRPDFPSIIIISVAWIRLRPRRKVSSVP